MFEPDPYVAECAAQAGPSPFMTLIRAAIEWQGWGAGSKAKPAYEASWKIGACLVALNGHPLAFKGGFTRDADAPVYPGAEGQPEIPDMLAVADAMLSPPLAALHGVLNRAVDDLRNYNFPAEDYADQAEADAAREAAWAEVETVAAWLARLPDPPATEAAGPDLSDSGPYATGEDSEMAAAAGVSVALLRRDRAAEDRA